LSLVCWPYSLFSTLKNQVHFVFIVLTSSEVSHIRWRGGGVNDFVQVLVSWCVQPILHLFGARVSLTSIRGWDVAPSGWCFFTSEDIQRHSTSCKGMYSMMGPPPRERESKWETHGSTKSYLHTLDQKPVRVTSKREREGNWETRINLKLLMYFGSKNH
jgi:hypothetical protein